MTALHTSYLLPGPTFFVEAGLFMVVVVGLVLVPVVQTVLLRQWVWTVLIVFLPPLGWLAWFARPRGLGMGHPDG